jgi:hypothetical protein
MTLTGKARKTDRLSNLSCYCKSSRLAGILLAGIDNRQYTTYAYSNYRYDSSAYWYSGSFDYELSEPTTF